MRAADVLQGRLVSWLYLGPPETNLVFSAKPMTTDTLLRADCGEDMVTGIGMINQRIFARAKEDIRLSVLNCRRSAVPVVAYPRLSLLARHQRRSKTSGWPRQAYEDRISQVARAQGLLRA